MNEVILMGRLTAEPEVKSTANSISYCRFNLAVDRKGKVQEGEERKTDFISCVAWRRTAEFIMNYVQKGQRVAVVGSIQTSKWTDENGNNRYGTDVVINSIYFADSKRGDGYNGGAQKQGEVEEVGDGDDLPF